MPLKKTDLGANEYWKSTEILREIASQLLSIITWDKNRAPHIIGTAFIVKSVNWRCEASAKHEKQGILALTACHNLQYMAQRQAIYLHCHPSTLPEFQTKSHRKFSLESKKVRVIQPFTQFPDMMRIIAANHSDNNDTALLTCVYQDIAKIESGKPVFGLSLKVPQIGEKVYALGFRDMKAFDWRDLASKRERLMLSHQIIGRIGYISDSFPNGDRRHPYPFFKTTIPIDPGMSGGPVLFYEGAKAGKVCGIISKDFSDPSSKENFGIAGDSTISMAWLAAGLQYPDVMVVHENEVYCDPLTSFSILLDLLRETDVLDLDDRSMRAVRTDKFHVCVYRDSNI